MFDACEREVRGFHRFLESWLAGDCPDTAARFARTDALGAPFELVSPDGGRRDRETLLADLRAGHGSLPGLAIEVRDVRSRVQTGDLALITYEEHQRRGSERTARLSSALFAPAPDAPEGVSWVHLHETWLPDGENSHDA
ncbi:DUF4440 domain-containing protein [Halomarina litorea]|uniref:DUF4440 domain-containing protein n=1 Tax=Halomarina litorea TaxID=2961595 RepID=UPI0020C2623A|nr:DUF4440 domain-containing protein [Halomarina sp. BCD28]